MSYRASCPRCRTILPPGRRFCLHCGFDTSIGRDTRETDSLRDRLVIERRGRPVSLGSGRRSRSSLHRKALVVLIGAGLLLLGGVVIENDDADERTTATRERQTQEAVASPIPD